MVNGKYKSLRSKGDKGQRLVGACWAKCPMLHYPSFDVWEYTDKVVIYPSEPPKSPTLSHWLGVIPAMEIGQFTCFEGIVT